MLHDAKQYNRIYLAYGYTDLRFGIDGLARWCRTISAWTHSKRAHFFYSAAGVRTASKDFYGRVMASCLYIKGWKTAGLNGQGLYPKPAKSRRNSSHG